MQDVKYGKSVVLDTTDFDEALGRVTEALGVEGFGVLTEIDVEATLKKKLGVDFRPYRILGACNPPLAHRALTSEPMIGLLLPCNVVVQEQEDGRINVSFVSPMSMFSVVENEELAHVADDVSDRLERVLSTLSS
jgi:uncharacterized protein (DUF302 family)